MTMPAIAPPDSPFDSVTTAAPPILSSARGGGGGRHWVQATAESVDSVYYLQDMFDVGVEGMSEWCGVWAGRTRA